MVPQREERTKRNPRKAKTRCPRHPLIVLGIVLELLLVGWMIAGLFAPAYCVEILPDTWPQDVQQTEGVQLAEDGVHISVPTASEGEEPSNVAVKFQTESFALKPGAYLITVAYQADSTSLSTTAGQVLLRESDLTSLLYAQDLPLDGAHTTVTGRAWVV